MEVQLDTPTNQHDKPPNDKPPSDDSLSGTNLHKVIQVGEAATQAMSATIPSVMGMGTAASKMANIAAVGLIAAMFTAAFFWLRSDAMAERADFRNQVLRQETQNEDRRREDRADRQRTEEMFRNSLENMSRDNRDAVQQMKVIGEQMRLATDAMVRVEKLLHSKSYPE